MSPSLPAVDFATTGLVDVSSVTELVDLFQARRAQAVRLMGCGTQQESLPAPHRPVLLVRTAPMARIVRLEAEDLTCSVEPGVPIAVLDAALKERGLALPVLHSGHERATVGGLFAVGAHGPAAPGAVAARSLLLGLEGVLSEGLLFRSGAKVVKSVAGFDLQKVFVGSRGRLFATTMLHLKLRPLPRSMVDFVVEDLDRETAVARFRDLRLLATPPTRLALRSLGGRHSIAGRLEGTVRQVRAALTNTGGVSTDREAVVPAHLAAPPGYETVVGSLRPSRITPLLALLDRCAGLEGADPFDPSLQVPVLIHGTGRFEAALPAPAVDLLLQALPTLEASGAIRLGMPARRGLATESDPVITRLERDLKRTLDTDDILC